MIHVTNSLFITLVHLTGVFLRYMPFRRTLSASQKRKLMISLAFVLVVQLVVISLVLRSPVLTPKNYKQIVFFGALLPFVMNCVWIPNQFFKHVFILTAQCIYSLSLHSLAALITHRHFSDATIQLQFLMQSLGFLMLFLGLSYPLYLVLRRTFILRISDEQHFHWKWIWLVPCFTLFSTMVATMNSNWISTWQQFLARIFMAFALIASWKCIDLDFREIDEKNRMQSENELLNAQINSITDSADVIEKEEEKLRILRHDMRHRTQLIHALVAENEKEKALELLEKLNTEMVPMGPVRYCRNHLLNAAISVHVCKAASFGISMTHELALPNELPIDEKDLAVLVANALENAVNASMSQPKGNRVIRIQAGFSQQQLVFRMVNVHVGKITFSHEGIPVSSEDGHGFGTKSIMTIVRKYHGSAVFTHENDLFTAGFLFPVPGTVTQS